MTYVCITGNEQSPAALQQRVERVLAMHPRLLCELRLDHLDLHPAAAFSFLVRLPADLAPRLVLTQRLKVSGPVAKGRCSWDVITWQSWWRDVMALRPWFSVDLDWIILDRLAGESLGWQGKFRSRHAFFSLHAPLAEVEQALPELIASAREHEAGVKIASPVETARDLARLASLSSRLQGLPIQIAVPMGPAGRAWRWSKLAGDITYFAVDSFQATAPGQDTLEAVLPYLATKQRPDLYLLLGDDPANNYGELRWNRSFLKRGAKSRYVNCPTADDPGAIWAESCLYWMESAAVKGASVTKPYKLSFPAPANTLKRTNEGWVRENTDGKAVAGILGRYGVRPGEKVVIAGSGGAARAVEQEIRSSYDVVIWSRNEGSLGDCPSGAVLVSTWPGPFQESLVQALQPRAYRLVLDAQLSRSRQESPLAKWCDSHNVRYLDGSIWWKAQARMQDAFWFGEDRLGSAKEKILQLVPSSKSETLRAMAIAAACGVPAEITEPAQNEDTDHLLRALELLGFVVDRREEGLQIFSPKELRAPHAPINMGDGATGLRVLAALSAVIPAGNLLLTGSKRLQERPSEELRLGLGLSGSGWPLDIPCGGPLPEKVSLSKSSQFATAFLIAAAGLIYRGRIQEYFLELEGDSLSESYLFLTMDLLKEAGFGAEMQGRSIRLTLKEKLKKFVFRIQKDASSLAFLDAWAARWNSGSLFPEVSRQGDSVFPKLLGQMREGKSVSIKDCPDLAPPLWAAAALLRLEVTVTDCPQLKWKESDRADLLVRAAIRLGADAEEINGGFRADFRSWVPPQEEVILEAGGDHRMAMAFGLLGLDDPGIRPDDIRCVAKSFPAYWEAMAGFEEALPG